MPITDNHNPRNFITKITNYENLFNKKSCLFYLNYYQ